MSLPETVPAAELWSVAALIRRLRASVGSPRHGALLLPEPEGPPKIMPWCPRCSGRTITLWRGPYPTDAVPVYEEHDGVQWAHPLSATEAADPALRAAYWEAADRWQSQPRPCEVRLSGLAPLVWWQAADCEVHERERRAAYLASVTLAAPEGARRRGPRKPT